MAECECLPECLFFNNGMAGIPAAADMFNKKYCRGDFQQGARHRVFTSPGRDQVPDDLFRDNRERAEKIMAVK